jgi:maltose O-acetyltransferase
MGRGPALAGDRPFRIINSFKLEIFMKKMVRILSLIAYYCFAWYLPTQPFPGWQYAYWIRRKLVKNIFEFCGADVIIKTKAYYGNGAKLRIGHRSQLGVNCRVEDNLVLGNDVVMGPDVVIMSSAHAFDRLDIPINQQGGLPRRPVVVGNDVWIGTRVVIMPGITIGDHAVIGANTVVTKDVPPKAVLVGQSARIVRYRGDRQS